ncbi:MAG: TonB-dependent receptor family protein [Pseudomonadota bacterium]
MMKYTNLLGLPLLAAPFYFSLPVLAQNESIDERMVVTATQTQSPWLTTPASVTRIDVKQQLPSLNIDAGDALEGVPGIQADSRYNYAQDSRLVIRGFGSRAAFGVRGIQLNVDGIPLSMPDGQAQTSSILLDEITSLEVLRGPLAVLYGNAGGGVVEWQSRAPATSQFNLATQQSDNDLQRYTVDGSYVNDDQQLRLLASDFSTNGPRPHNSAERQQQAFRWFSQLTERQRLVFRYDNNYAPLLEDPSALTPAAFRQDPEQTVQRAIDFNTRKAIHHRQGSLSWFYEAEALTHRISLWQGDRDITQFLPFSGDGMTSSGAVIDLSRQFEGVHAFSHWQPSSTLSLSAGWMTENQQDHRKGFVNDMGDKGELRRDEFNHIQNHSLYSRVKWQLSSDWSLDAGARYNWLDYQVNDFYINPQNPDDSGEKEFDELSIASALTWQISDRISGYLSYGEGFETPTLTELAYRNEGSGLNNQLSPSTNEQLELGLKAFIINDWRLGLSLFDISSSNEILVDRSIDGRTTYRNAAKTSRYGAEFSAEGQFTDTLSGYFSYSSIIAEFDSGALAGNRLPGVSDQQLFGRLNWSLPQQWQVKLAARYRGETYSSDDNNIAAPAYTLFDVAVEKSWDVGEHQFSGWFMLDNLTDKQYVGAVVVNQGSGRAFEPGVGRQVSVGLKWHRRF